MAKKGTYTALSQTTPTKLEFGQMAKDVAVEERARLERKAAKAEKEAARQEGIAQNFQTDYATLGDVITGTDSIDEAFARGIGKARDRMGEIYKQIQTNPSLANDVSTQLELQNLKGYSKNLKTSSDKITEFNTKLAQGVQDGTLSAWNDKHLDIGESIFRFNNLDIGVNAKGLPSGATVQLDGEGNMILGNNGQPIIEELNIPQVLGGGGLPELVPRYDMAASAMEIGPKLGARAVKDSNGNFMENEYQEFSAIEGGVRNLVKGIIGSVGNPTAEAKSIWTDVLGNRAQDFDEADMKEIEDAYVGSVQAFYDEKRSETKNYSAANTAAENYRKRLKDEADAKAAKDKLDAEQNGNSNFTVITDEDEVPLMIEFQGVTGDIQGKGYRVALPYNSDTEKSTITVVGGAGKEVEVTELYLMESGELAYKGYQYDGKVTADDLESDNAARTSKRILIEGVGGGKSKNDRILTAIAKSRGLENEGQLKKLVEEQVEEAKINSYLKD
tara:strand:- start:19385 stop:20890 length:1506 start_codon:yes stop_codon:yes gene_type:complete